MGKIMNNNTMQYLNPQEREVVGRLAYEKISIITKEQFDGYFNFPKRVGEKTLFRLKKKGILTAIKRGVYFYSPLESGPAGSRINEFLVPPALFPKSNYYIGYSTMYNYYGFSDQIFQTMYILNASFQREKTIGSMRFKMIKIPAKRMFGLEKIKIKDTEVRISDRERTLVDLIYFPGPVGGLKRAFEILKDQVNDKKTDINKLIRYTVKFPNISARKRIGFVLEQAGLRKKRLEPLLKSVKRTSLITVYPSKSRRGRINKKWKVIENAT
jgi:predicted transcriptional regulator of viral defense system